MKPRLDWEVHRVTIARLYVTEKKILKDVMRIMSKRHAFLAPPKLYKEQLKKWGIMRNLNRPDVAVCVYALEEIEREGTKKVVLLRERVITRADINTYLKKAKITEEYLRSLIPKPSIWPAHIVLADPKQLPQTPPRSRGAWAINQGILGTCETFDRMTPSGPTTPSWNVSDESSRLHTPRSSLSQRTSSSSMYAVAPNSVWDNGTFAPNQSQVVPGHDSWMEQYVIFEEDEVTDADLAGICIGVDQSNTFEAMVQQTVAPQPLSSGGRASPMMFSLISGTAPDIYRAERQRAAAAEVQAVEAVFPVDTEKGVEHSDVTYPEQMSILEEHPLASSTSLSASFLSRCFNACIARGQKFHENAKTLESEAATIFERMIIRNDQYCLTTLNLLTSFLEAHGQRSAAQNFLHMSLGAARKYLRDDDAVCITIDFMAGIVSDQPRHSKYSGDKLKTVYQELVINWGIESPPALTGLYHVAWKLALHRGTCHEAWTILKDLNLKCEHTFGRCHIQTITSMMTSARVLHHLGEPWEAGKMINRAIERLDLMYEEFHPYRLEARSRQATLLKELEGHWDIETIWQDVVQKQAAILGSENIRTQSTMNKLQKLLTDKGRIEEANHLPQFLENISMQQTFDRHCLEAYQENHRTSTHEGQELD